MNVLAKCHNYTGCLLAYRGEDIPLAPGAPMVCPECGKPLIAVPKNAKLMRILPWAVFFAILLGGGIAALPFLKSHMSKSEVEATPAPGTPHRTTTTPFPVSTPLPLNSSEPEPGNPPPHGATPMPVATPLPMTTPPLAGEEAPTPPIVPAKIEMNPERGETKAVRDEVLRRIDLMPNVTPVNKDKLYNSVQRARSMGLVLTLPFASGRSAISAGDVPALNNALQAPVVMKLREDPTAVFVVLGYADSKGDEKKNLAISQERADSIVTAMRSKCGVVNVTHAVAMGGTTLLDAQALEKNRIVEIWVVLP